MQATVLLQERRPRKKRRHTRHHGTSRINTGENLCRFVPLCRVAAGAAQENGQAEPPQAPSLQRRIVASRGWAAISGPIRRFRTGRHGCIQQLVDIYYRKLSRGTGIKLRVKCEDLRTCDNYKKLKTMESAGNNRR